MQAAKQGKVIVYPTDTQYALGCSITFESGILKIFKLKKRPEILALPIAVSSSKDIQRLTYITPSIQKIISTFLPGPLTLILHARPEINPRITANKNTVGIRIPNHPITLKLLKKTGPLIVTSANIHGQKPYEDIKDIQKQFGKQIDVY